MCWSFCWFFLYKICCSWCMSIYKPPSCHQIYQLCKPVTCTRPITFESPLKGILNIYINIPVFSQKMLSIRGWISRETFAVFQYSDSLAYFEISNPNHHCQTGYNYNILTWIIKNLLGRNTMRLTWKHLLNNSHRLFWEGRTNAYYTTQNT